MAGEEAAIGAMGVLIFAGLLGRLFLRRTGVSDVFLLMLFGAAAGALMPEQAVRSLDFLLLPLGAVALLMIILDEGLRLPFAAIKRHAHKVALFWLLSFPSALAVSFAASHYLLGLDEGISLLISAIFSSVAPELLSGFLHARGASDEAKAIGELEATFSDALSVMLTLIFLSAAVGNRAGALFSELPLQIAFILLFSAAIGSLFAAFWKKFVSHHLAQDNEHLFAIGLAALLYATAGFAGGNGVIAVFVFGLFLGNAEHRTTHDVRKLQSQISFFLRTFFFVYLGMRLFHSPMPLEVALFAAALSLLLAFARFLSGKVAGFIEPSVRKGRLLEAVSSRGLTAAVLSVVVAGDLSRAGVPLPYDLPLLALFVIFFTNAISAWLVLRRRDK